MKSLSVSASASAFGTRIRNMSRNAARWTPMLALLFCTAQIQAATFEVVGAKLDLPFEYTLQQRSKSYEREYGLTLFESVEMRITSGPHAGQELRVAVYARSSDRLDSAVMQQVVRSYAEEQISKPGVRMVEPMKLDGFDFYFMDLPVDGKDFNQAMRVDGVINGTIYRLAFFAKSAAPLDADLNRALRATRLDYPSLLKLTPNFSLEQTAAVDRTKLLTPAGTVTLPDGLNAVLINSLVVEDGEGKLVLRKRGYSLRKIGFWTEQRMYFTATCGTEANLDADRFVRMVTAESSPDGSDAEGATVGAERRETQFLLVGKPADATVAGMPGRFSTGKWTSDGKVPTSAWVRRWATAREGVTYQYQLARFSGPVKVEQEIAKQVAAASGTCRVDLPFGASATSQPAKPPVAPPAAAPAAATP